jgi:hypothetical protein
MHQVILQETTERLVIGLPWRYRVYTFGFSFSLTFLTLIALAFLREADGVSFALMIPLLAMMLIIGLLGLYRVFALHQDIYDKQQTLFSRYRGNWWSGRRLIHQYSWAELNWLENDNDIEQEEQEEQENQENYVILQHKENNIDIALDDYSTEALRQSKVLLGDIDSH